MEVIAISTQTSRINNEYNGNLKQIFQDIINDKDDCNIIVSSTGVEQAIPVKNGKIISKLLEQSIINLITVSLGTVAFHVNTS